MSIVLPINISFNDWIGSLQTDYSTNEVPIHFQESEWRLFVDAVKRLNTFANDDTPSHQGFATWQDWAMRLTQVLNA